MSDPLARRMVTCSWWSDDAGNCDELDEFKATCGGCNDGLVPEPAERWAERCVKIARYLAADCGGRENGACEDCPDMNDDGSCQGAQRMLEAAARAVEEEG